MARRIPLQSLAGADGRGSSPAKLFPLASAIAELLESHFGAPAKFALEHPLSWIDTLPTPSSFQGAWKPICLAYKELVEGRYELPARIAECHSTLLRGPQRADVWFEPPYAFILEFDEQQHFNQFRLVTLRAASAAFELPFDLQGYLEQCTQQTIRPGTSGFTFLKTPDPLFPPLLPGDRQDNRVRQRAFRDLLKDIAPIGARRSNPTLRVGNYLLQGKRNDFSREDCRRVCDHLRLAGSLSHLQLR